ncbi:MAG TPA: hypothetical protein DCL41_08575 [Bdellovibrionales bacterium]|nr:hypothetical protein [Pseudobdellovibrionaceae bacterium]HAG91912.1 hypothetical protein [Bdellovibrionales bacterium]|tara:strand:- start:5261 stop:5512 length:252 start_codon:yes stop_codon:yes gene_type:complete
MAKKKIKYAKTDGLENSDFAVSKVRITTMVDKDILDWLKREAKKSDGKYQTILNNILRQAKGTNPDRLADLESRLEELEKKIS